MVDDPLRKSVRQGGNQIEEEPPWRRRKGEEGCGQRDAERFCVIFPFNVQSNFTE